MSVQRDITTWGVATGATLQITLTGDLQLFKYSEYMISRSSADQKDSLQLLTKTCGPLNILINQYVLVQLTVNGQR